MSQLAQLRSLNLSFNRVTKLEGIHNLYLLEVLELGKNYISDVDALVSNLNPLIHLQELYLYMNELRSLPLNLSFPQLKTLNLNRNQDLGKLSLSYCPLLDYISCSYCSLTSIESLHGCPSLTFLDVSFNKIESLDLLLRSLHLCKNLQSLVYKDNLFNEHEHDPSE